MSLPAAAAIAGLALVFELVPQLFLGTEAAGRGGPGPDRDCHVAPRRTPTVWRERSGAARRAGRHPLRLSDLCRASETLWYALVARVLCTMRARRIHAWAKTWIDRGFGGPIALFGVKIATG